VNVRQGAQSASLRRAQQYLKGHPSDAAELSEQTRRKLDVIADRLEAAIDVQATRVRQLRGEWKRRLKLERDLLLGYVTPIAKFSRAEVASSPELAALTPSSRHLDGRRLVNFATSMMKVATRNATHFSHGWGTDFLGQATAAVDAIAESMDRHGNLKVQRAGATAGLASLIAKGRNLLLQLDAVVEAKFDREGRFYQEWKIAIRVGEPAAKKKRVRQVSP
jgi:hypothetical protein